MTGDKSNNFQIYITKHYRQENSLKKIKPAILTCGH